MTSRGQSLTHHTWREWHENVIRFLLLNRCDTSMCFLGLEVQTENKCSLCWYDCLWSDLSKLGWMGHTYITCYWWAQINTWNITNNNVIIFLTMWAIVKEKLIQKLWAPLYKKEWALSTDGVAFGKVPSISPSHWAV